MIRIETDRLVILSDAEVINEKLVFPKKAHSTIDIFGLKPRPEATGFAMYQKTDCENVLGQFGFRQDRYTNELAYETNPAYRRQHYMQEAMETFIPWFFDNTSESIIYGIIAEGNIPSENLALKVGFQRTGVCAGGSPLYWIKKSAPVKCTRKKQSCDRIK